MTTTPTTPASVTATIRFRDLPVVRREESEARAEATSPPPKVVTGKLRASVGKDCRALYLPGSHWPPSSRFRVFACACTKSKLDCITKYFFLVIYPLIHLDHLLFYLTILETVQY